MTDKIYAGKCVFGLDIGTRSIVGTVGYQDKGKFYILAQKSIEHETRAMLDGQIHDISKVGDTIRQVKEALEEKLDMKLSNVCIAAAGRVLKTLDVHVDYSFEEDQTITEEDILALSSKGVEQAYVEFQKQNQSDIKFYCVGYSVVRYYLNGYPMSNLLDHRAKTIGVDMIATFLPNDVVDGIYKAVELAGLNVVNLTLEPIAAIIVAIPDRFRMLNIALVDVGAGTSDISITRDGSIFAYGMIPVAGDILTETIAKHCLVDFTTAEKIKKKYTSGQDIEFEDIMGLPQTIDADELKECLQPVINSMAHDVAEKMVELNGGKPVSAVFVVGGGGKITDYTETLSGYLQIPKERVALRGKEVMDQIEFLDSEGQKDSLFVTPIGICLSFYEQSNNLVFVTFNCERVKLYDNGKLAVVDAAMNADFSSVCLFPKRGTELEFTMNSKSRIVRGELGEAAIITVNGENADIHTRIHENDIILVRESTAGAKAVMTIGNLPEATSTIEIIFNGKKVTLPKFALVNGEIKTGFYEIQSGDQIEMSPCYEIQQILDFMDLIPEPEMNIYVNHQKADRNTKVYHNFDVQMTLEKLEETIEQETVDQNNAVQDDMAQENTVHDDVAKENTVLDHPVQSNQKMIVLVNGTPVTLQGKSEYIFVDVFDYIHFDLTRPQGHGIITNVNGEPAQYMNPIHDGDIIEIYWKIEE